MYVHYRQQLSEDHIASLAVLPVSDGCDAPYIDQKPTASTDASMERLDTNPCHGLSHCTHQ